MLAEDYESELAEIRPRLQELVEFKVEQDNLIYDHERSNISKHMNTFTASIDTKEDMYNLDINHLMMSNAENDMNNRINTVKTEMNKSYENIIHEFNNNPKVNSSYDYNTNLRSNGFNNNYDKIRNNNQLDANRS